MYGKMENITQQKWRCFGKSVRGTYHWRSELRNQDAIQWYPGHPETGVGLPVILAVSDGHGSAKSFRSEKGSQFAVSTAIRVIQEFFLATQNSDINFSTLKDGTERLLPQRLVSEWRTFVQQHLQEHPFTDEERQNLVKEDGESAWKAVEDNNFLAYGATLLAVLVTESFIVYIQLGDGDILEVDSQGETTRILERDPRLIANETTSLCMNKAWNEFQIHLEQYPKGISKEMPALILVSTDGYSNSFSTDEGFFKIGKDYLNMFKSNSAEEVSKKLGDFLEETSDKGSGDDITLGIIRRAENDDWDLVDLALSPL
ncbi:PP2C family serine/threonine-protein phosphatase [Cylindrospermopsis raciborskii]|uniref:PP2C family serine/threonine-protein phosphatase n=1 Tax=Cylindrospermopsis raciborskii TaxID=77022 RepID=UPI003DA4CD23